MLAVVRIRGKVNTSQKVEDTLRMMGIVDINNCVVVPEEPRYTGTVEKMRDIVAYGKISKEVFFEMLRKRGRLVGDRKIDEENVKTLGFKSIEELAKSIFEGRTRMTKVEGLLSVFRLTPPSGGHKSTKDHYPRGSLGDWGEKINELIERMI